MELVTYLVAGFQLLVFRDQELETDIVHAHPLVTYAG